MSNCHTVARSMYTAPEWEVTTARTKRSAALAFAFEAWRLIDSNGMCDTRSGWAFMRRAKAVARAIDAGTVTAADLHYMGRSVTYTAAN